ncbi:beta-lactamase-like protein [Blastocladiella britannica]|nr:beta-lactamase-like protein [Blastocladiella britannica]
MAALPPSLLSPKTRTAPPSSTLTNGTHSSSARSSRRDEETMHFMPIGAGSEVGRSCHILKFKGKTLMLDCGSHPAYNGLGALPFLDEIDPETVDLVLITHFHLDHCASLPYFMEKTTFKGRVFMTHPTKAIFRWMLSDYVRVSSSSADDTPYDEHDLQRAYDRIEVVDFHQQVDVGGVRFTAYNAGHVLGAAMFQIEIAGVRVLYTGDYSREEDRHLMAAEKPRDSVDVLVCESTYGVQNHTPRGEREARFTSLVHQIVARGGRCLVPIFALGRTQELLLILDEYWSEHPELQHIPIYYASNLARKCMAVYQTYMNMMNGNIRRQFAVKNPFAFKFIQYLRSMASFDDVGPCVMLAAPAMLQSGLSRELLEMWCPDKKNGLIIPGYVVEGTLGKHMLTEPSEISSYSGNRLPVRCSIDYISFSAHVDYMQNRDFINLIHPSHLILVHGETNMMTRLKNALLATWASDEYELPPKVHAPKNAETVALHFKGEKFAKALGMLAVLVDAATRPLAAAPLAIEEGGSATVVADDGIQGEDASESVTAVTAGPDAMEVTPSDIAEPAGEVLDAPIPAVPTTTIVQGLVVSKDFHYHLLAVDELREFTDLRPATIHMRQYVPLESATWDLVIWHLGLVYPETLVVSEVDLAPTAPIGGSGGIKPASPPPDADRATAKVATQMNRRAVVDEIVTITMPASQRELLVEWIGNPVNDVLADAVMAVLLHVESSPVSVKMTSSGQSKKCGHGHDDHETQADNSDLDSHKDENPALVTVEVVARKVKSQLVEFLRSSFDYVDDQPSADADAPTTPVSPIVVRLDGCDCVIDLVQMKITCENEGFRNRVRDIVEYVGLSVSEMWMEEWLDQNP